MSKCSAMCRCSFCTEKLYPLDVLRGQVTKQEFTEYCTSRLEIFKDTESQARYKLWLQTFVD